MFSRLSRHLSGLSKGFFPGLRKSFHALHHTRAFMQLKPNKAGTHGSMAWAQGSSKKQVLYTYPKYTKIELLIISNICLLRLSEILRKLLDLINKLKLNHFSLLNSRHHGMRFVCRDTHGALETMRGIQCLQSLNRDPPASAFWKPLSY